MGAFNWAGDQQREITNEQAVIDDIYFRFDPAFVDINDIRKPMKGIE